MWSTFRSVCIFLLLCALATAAKEKKKKIPKLKASSKGQSKEKRTPGTPDTPLTKRTPDAEEEEKDLFDDLEVITTDTYSCQYMYRIEGERDFRILDKPEVNTIDACAYECSQIKKDRNDVDIKAALFYAHIVRNSETSNEFTCHCGKVSDVRIYADSENKASRACILMSVGPIYDFGQNRQCDDWTVVIGEKPYTRAVSVKETPEECMTSLGQLELNSEIDFEIDRDQHKCYNTDRRSYYPCRGCAFFKCKVKEIPLYAGLIGMTSYRSGECRDYYLEGSLDDETNKHILKVTNDLIDINADKSWKMKLRICPERSEYKLKISGRLRVNKKIFGIQSGATIDINGFVITFEDLVKNKINFQGMIIGYGTFKREPDYSYMEAVLYSTKLNELYNTPFEQNLPTLRPNDKFTGQSSSIDEYGFLVDKRMYRTSSDWERYVCQYRKNSDKDESNKQCFTLIDVNNAESGKGFVNRKLVPTDLLARYEEIYDHMQEKRNAWRSVAYQYQESTSLVTTVINTDVQSSMDFYRQQNIQQGEASETPPSSFISRNTALLLKGQSIRVQHGSMLTIKDEDGIKTYFDNQQYRGKYQVWRQGVGYLFHEWLYADYYDHDEQYLYLKPMNKEHPYQIFTNFPFATLSESTFKVRLTKERRGWKHAGDFEMKEVLFNKEADIKLSIDRNTYKAEYTSLLIDTSKDLYDNIEESMNNLRGTYRVPSFNETESVVFENLSAKEAEKDTERLVFEGEICQPENDEGTGVKSFYKLDLKQTSSITRATPCRFAKEEGTFTDFFRQMSHTKYFEASWLKFKEIGIPLL